MKPAICGLCFSLLILLANPGYASAKHAIVDNRIDGQVYDPERRPVQNLYVELLSEVDSVIQRTKTNASGRFSFIGVPPGHLRVRVVTYGTNFAEQVQEIDIVQTRNNNDRNYLDVYLRYETRRRGRESDLPPGVIFAQDVPPNARATYLKGVADFERDQDKGLAEIEEAIKIFPNYFEALNWLGKEYVSRGNYEKAYPYLLKAIDVNQRSAPTYYSLGYAFYQLKQYPAALEAARATTVLAPGSVDAQLLYGTVLRITEKYPEAEAALLKANSLAKELNAEVHWQLSLLYNRLNRNQDTINELEAYLKLVPDSPDKHKIRDMIGKLKTAIDKKE